MTFFKKILFALVFALAATTSMSEPLLAEQRRGAQTYSDVPAIKKWAKQSFLGSRVQKFAKGERELVVVSGLRTSGVATTELVVLGRPGSKAEFRALLKTATFMTLVSVRQVENGVTVEAEGKMVLQIPFELVALEVHTGL